MKIHKFSKEEDALWWLIITFAFVHIAIRFPHVYGQSDIYFNIKMQVSWLLLPALVNGSTATLLLCSTRAHTFVDKLFSTLLVHSIYIHT